MEWFAVPAVIGLAWLVAYFHPDAIRARRYEAELAERESVNDRALFSRFFSASEVTPDIPGRVRAAFAKHMGYPAEKMLPDDDLLFFWNELDMLPLILDIEEAFRLEITDADAATVPVCTIRAVSMLVERLRSARRSEPTHQVETMP